jgi:glutamate formiminotransferase
MKNLNQKISAKIGKTLDKKIAEQMGLYWYIWGRVNNQPLSQNLAQIQRQTENQLQTLKKHERIK